MWYIQDSSSNLTNKSNKTTLKTCWKGEVNWLERYFDARMKWIVFLSLFLSSFQSAETLMIGLTKWKQLSIRPHILPPEADRLLMIQVKNRPLPDTCYTGIVPVIGDWCVSVKHSQTKAKPLLTLMSLIS